jgi:hypothetical protein
MTQLTIVELKERLKQVDELLLLELLNLSSEDIVNAFPDLIEDSYDLLNEHVDWDENDI